MSDETQITDAELQAYADGRLGEERSRAVEAWLAARPEDAERVAAYRRLGEELRRAYDPVLDEPLPDWLARAPRRRNLRPPRPQIRLLPFPSRTDCAQYRPSANPARCEP